MANVKPLFDSIGNFLIISLEKSLNPFEGSVVCKEVKFDKIYETIFHQNAFN